MPQGQTQRPLPQWLIVVASVALIFHFSAFSFRVLAARSGPWSTDIGPTQMEPPAFAAMFNNFASGAYLEPLGLTHNYQFLSNRTNLSAVKVEVRQINATGKVGQKVLLPDPQANFWVRERQKVLAWNLGDDQGVQQARRNVSSAPGQERPKIPFWLTYEGPTAPREVYHAEEPPAEALAGPSPWSLLLAKSFARHGQRDALAGRVEVVRTSRAAVYPALILLETPPPGAFDELVCNFGTGNPKLYVPTTPAKN
jgi:hypothetical protein